MLKTLTLINTTNNIQFVFDNCNFILTNYVFDNVNMSHTTSKTTKQVGSTVTATSVASRNLIDRKITRLNSSHTPQSRIPS